MRAEDPTGTEERPARRPLPRPRRIGAAVCGLVAIGVAGWVLGTRWSTVIAGHPSYPIVLGALAVAGLAMLTWSTRARRRRRRGGWNRAVRAVPAIVLLLLALAVGWLRPFAAVTPEPAGVVDLSSRIELRPASASAATATGLVFYPGARVDPRAYIPLLAPLAAAGHLVVILKPPLGLPLIDSRQADEALDAHPEVGRWVVGGHSMGGVAAAAYAAPAASRAAGLVLWAAYPADDLSARTTLATVSISGTADALTTPEDIRDSHADLPPGTRFVAVTGAVHADFGDYGPQPGDGVATIDHAAAQQQIRDATLAALSG